MNPIVIWHEGTEETLSRDEFYRRASEMQIPKGALVRNANAGSFTTPDDFLAQNPPPPPPAEPTTTREKIESAAALLLFLLVLGGALYSAGSKVAGVALFLLPGIVIYFIPSVVALERRHHQKHAIIATNILLGWTFLGWAAALIWALTVVRKDLQA